MKQQLQRNVLKTCVQQLQPLKLIPTVSSAAVSLIPSLVGHAVTRENVSLIALGELRRSLSFITYCAFPFESPPITDRTPVARKKKRKREGPPKKRGPTGYTLFFQESYESIKKAHSGENENVDSKDVLMLIARQWNEIGDDEKEAWQYKAEQLRATQAAEAIADAASAAAGPVELPIMAEIEEIGLHEPPSEDWNGNKKRPARKNPPKSSASVDV